MPTGTLASTQGRSVVRFAPGAKRFAAVAVVLAFAGYLFSPWLSPVAVALGLFVLVFFRDPERTPPESGFVAPADGKVSVIREEDGHLRVGVFMNVGNVHVNRAPGGGVVRSTEHTAGAHRPAFSKDSDNNERLHVEFDDHAVVLIAGAFARRIFAYVEPGDDVERGERIGHIAFGSRADVLLPAGIERDDLQVEKGDRVRAGETVVAARP